MSRLSVRLWDTVNRDRNFWSIDETNRDSGNLVDLNQLRNDRGQSADDRAALIEVTTGSDFVAGDHVLLRDEVTTGHTDSVAVDPRIAGTVDLNEIDFADKAAAVEFRLNPNPHERGNPGEMPFRIRVSLDCGAPARVVLYDWEANGSDPIDLGQFNQAQKLDRLVVTWGDLYVPAGGGIQEDFVELIGEDGTHLPISRRHKKASPMDVHYPLPFKPRWVAFRLGNDKKTLGETSVWGPSIAGSDGDGVLAWTGLDGRLNITASEDALAFSGRKRTFNKTAEQRPCVARFNGRSVLLWRGGLSTPLRYTYTQPPGAAWEQQEWSEAVAVKLLHPGEAVETAVSDLAPSVAVFPRDGAPHRLFAAWAGPDGKIHVAYTRHLLWWEGHTVLEESTDAPPVLVASPDEILLAWKGIDPKGSLNVARSTDGLRFVNKVVFPDSTDRGPALAFHDGSFFIAWSDARAGRRLCLRQRREDGIWSDRVVLPEVSNDAPALVSQDGFLVIAWTGLDSHLNVRRVSMGYWEEGLPNLQFFQPAATVCQKSFT